MSYGEGDLQAWVSELLRENGVLRQGYYITHRRWMALRAEIARLRRRVAELERENARLRASLLALTDCDRVDWPSIALDWDGANDSRKREWCQWLYERAAKQDGRVFAQDGRIAELESLARDMRKVIAWHEGDDEVYDDGGLFDERMREMGIGEGDES